MPNSKISDWFHARTTVTTGWSGGAKVLGKLPVPGRPANWIIVGRGPIALAVGAGGGCLDIFSLIYHFSFLSPSLWETARYRLKYCLKGPLSLNTTNQSTSHPDWSIFIQLWKNSMQESIWYKFDQNPFNSYWDIVKFMFVLFLVMADGSHLGMPNCKQEDH